MHAVRRRAAAPELVGTRVVGVEEGALHVKDGLGPRLQGAGQPPLALVQHLLEPHVVRVQLRPDLHHNNKKTAPPMPRPQRVAW